MKRILVLMIVVWAGAAEAADVLHRPYGARKEFIGAVREYRVRPGESLIEIARAFRLGYNEIVSANPSLDPFVPGEGEIITVPTGWIVPEAHKREGIVINLSEMRLYLFVSTRRSHRIATFPVGIGREGWNTPTGTFKIIEKLTDPPWYVPPSIRKTRPELPAVAPPGEETPLGTHALRLSRRTILIHGTNRPWAVGRKASYGCLRLYPEDIPLLYERVETGTRVEVVRQPVKAGLHGRRVYVEVHHDARWTDEQYREEAVNLLTQKGLIGRTDMKKLGQALTQKAGFPVPVSPG